jgi:antitoxin component of MazEF toxin-antitoxin module
MLKKLVKFGNSTALVIDKPILELLGMQEYGMVHLHSTDGKSLTISPISGIHDKPALANALIKEKYYEKSKEEFDTLPVETQQKLDNDLDDVFKQHTANMMKFGEAMISNVEVKQAIEKLSAECDPMENPELYAKKFNIYFSNYSTHYKTIFTGGHDSQSY